MDQRHYQNQITGFEKFNGKPLLAKGSWRNKGDFEIIGLKTINTLKDSVGMDSFASFSGEKGVVYHVLKKPNSTGFLAIIFETGCNKLPRGNYLFHLDHEFTRIGRPKRITYFFRNINKALTEAFFLNDKILILSHENLLLSYHMDEQRVQNFNDSIPSFGHFQPISDKLFGCTDGDKLNIINEQCQVEESSIVGLSCLSLSGLANQQKGFMTVGRQNLLILNGVGSPIYSHSWDDLSIHFDSLEGSYLHRDSVFILGFWQGMHRLASLSDQLEVQWVLDLDHSLQEFIDLIFYRHKIISGFRYKQNEQFLDFVQIHNRKSRLENIQTALSISELSIDTSNLKSAQMDLHGFFELNCTVKNESNDTVQGVVLNWRSAERNGCRTMQKSYVFDSEILPLSDNVFHIKIVDSFLEAESNYDLCLQLSPRREAWRNKDTQSVCVSLKLPPSSVASRNNLPKIELPTTVRGGEQWYHERPLDLELYGLDGQRLYSKSGNLHVWPLLPSGFYVARLIIENQVYSQLIRLLN